MAKQFESIDARLKDFIDRQHIFFTASATGDSRVNISPRETGSLRVIDANKIVYLDRTGSGNETSAHLRADGRLTIMFCAVQGPPMILRLYGRGRTIRRDSSEYGNILLTHFGGSEPSGARQFILLEIDLVQTSCGSAFRCSTTRPSGRAWTNGRTQRARTVSRSIAARRTATALTGFRLGCSTTLSRIEKWPILVVAP